MPSTPPTKIISKGIYVKKQAKSYKKVQEDIAQSALNALLQKQGIKGAVVVITDAKSATAAMSYSKDNLVVRVGLTQGLQSCAGQLLKDVDNVSSHKDHAQKESNEKSADIERVIKAALFDALINTI